MTVGHAHSHEHEHSHQAPTATSTSPSGTLRIYSPAGVVRSAAQLQRGVRRLGKLGFAVEVDEAARLKQQRFAGDDETRLAAIHRTAA
ncbi:MAG: LD-carboxypeptidase, partial [Caldimonas sp.]